MVRSGALKVSLKTAIASIVPNRFFRTLFWPLGREDLNENNLSSYWVAGHSWEHPAEVVASHHEGL